MSLHQPRWKPSIEARNARQEKLRQSIFYQIYPPSFRDANGDGIGDLEGIRSKLPHLQSLGIDVIWLSPIFCSMFKDGGYDITDFFNVDPRYGDNAALQRLCAEGREHGISVCLDLVAGHTSDQNPWFKASCQAEANEHTDRYVWTDDPWLTRHGTDNFMSGNADRHGSYLINFFCHQPALNYGYADVQEPWQQPLDAPGPQSNREMLRNVMQHWIDLGAGGFRVDMAHSLIKNDPFKVEIRRLWREMRGYLDTFAPEVFLISEFGNPEIAVDSGFDFDFMLHWGMPGYPSLIFNETGWITRESCFFEAKGEGDFNLFHNVYELQRERIQGKGHVSVPTANHDFQRPNCGSRGPEETFPFLMFVYTWPSVPTLYYGDEVAMRYLENTATVEGGYERTGTRTPMQWDRSANAGFSTAAADKLFLPIDPNYEQHCVEAAEADPASHLHFLRELARLHHALPALWADADYQVLDTTERCYPLVYLREQGDTRLLVALNPRKVEERFALPAGVRIAEDLLSRDAVLEGDTLVLKPFGCGLYRLG